jgi:hypothetical protein
MTSSLSGAAGHVGDGLLARYAAGTAGTVDVWSAEAHLAACARCRSALAGYADADRLARNRAVLLTRAALPGEGRARRLLCRCGVPDHVLRLLMATPSLRRSWLLSVVSVLAVVTGLAEAIGHGWLAAARTAGPAAHPVALVPYVLVAPLLVLAGVAAAFLPTLDPAYRLTVAAPFSGFSLLLVRTVSALAAALVPVVAAAFVLPGPRWLPAALLLPSLALSGFALAASTVVNPRVAALTAGAAWALPALLLSTTRVPLMIVERNAQLACLGVLCACAVVLLTRHDRFDLGWTR